MKEYVQPLAGISLEKSEYIVSEQIGREYRALQICAVATDLLYPMQTGLIFQNGSATGTLMWHKMWWIWILGYISIISVCFFLTFACAVLNRSIYLALFWLHHEME